MFDRLGRLVSRFPIPLVLFWLVFGGVAIGTAPEWSSVAREGEFAFLPAGVSSREAEAVYRQAFPDATHSVGEEHAESNVHQNPLNSNVVLVVGREDLPDGLTPSDLAFVNNVLRPGLETIALTTVPYYAGIEDASRFIMQVVRKVVERVNAEGASSSSAAIEAELRSLLDAAQPPPAAADEADASGELPLRVLPRTERVVASVWTFKDKGVGPLLISNDKKSTLLLVELNTEFLDRDNGLVLDRVEAFLKDLVENRGAYPAERRIPANLELALSGSATVGRDMLHAERQSTRNTELWTKILVIVLLLVIYRAPVLVIIPLITVGLTVELTIGLLRHMAALGWVGVFSSLEIYVTVVVYGAGVDFCLFLIARYREELDSGATFEEAIASAINRVGIALATSAGTSIAGIAMMMFAEFGKFPQAGFAISFGLGIVLCCALTLTPALLRLSGRWVFWPDVRREQISAQEGWIPTTSGWSLLSRDPQWVRSIWDKIAALIERRPGTVCAGSILVLLPFVVIALLNYNRLSYGLLSELRPEVTSVIGAQAVKQHFPAGMTGITTVILRNEDFDFIGSDRLSDGEKLSAALTAELKQRAGALHLVEVRSQSHPLGNVGETAGPRSVAERILARRMAQKAYVSLHGPLAGDAVRLDLVFDFDPFSRESIDRLTQAETAVREALIAVSRNTEFEPGDEDAALYASLPRKTDVFTIGSTASVRDLKSVTDRDRVTIAVLVTIAVYLVLITLLGRPAISLYLIATVVFSFLATLGMTHVVFYLRNPDEYAGVDWKAPIFVFTILVAMGEDYNVLLMARVDEEQRRHGSVRGVLVALTRTGGIISSCGIIMAGTFASLMTGTLMGIIQLGFALAFGVLLDTFVVRPIMVPSYLVLLYQGRFGRFGRFLGYRETTSARGDNVAGDEGVSPRIDGPHEREGEASRGGPPRRAAGEHRN